MIRETVIPVAWLIAALFIPAGVVFGLFNAEPATPAPIVVQAVQP